MDWLLIEILLIIYISISAEMSITFEKLEPVDLRDFCNKNR